MLLEQDDGIDLAGSKTRLLESFNDNRSNRDAYFVALKLWFSDRISKEEFDTLARRLIQPAKIHTHNEFFLAILAKCQLQFQNFGRTFENKRSSRGRRVVKRLCQPKPFLASDVTTDNFVPVVTPPHFSLDCVRPSVYDGLLPSAPMLYGRCYLSAFEHGLSEVDKDVVTLLALALDSLLKNVLQAAIELRRSYLLYDGRFPHSYGAKRARPGTSSQVVTTIAAHPKRKLSCEDLVGAIQLQPKVVPSASVRVKLVEYLLANVDEL